MSTTLKSGVPGVYWDRERSSWRVSIYIKGKDKYVGESKDLQEATKLRLSAEKGLFPTDEYKRIKMFDKMYRIRMRLVWREVLKEGENNWSCFDHFLQTIEERPSEIHWIAAKNKNLQLGPENFMWIKKERDQKKYDRELRLKNYDRYRNNELVKTFNITLKEYKVKLIEQKGVCACCGQPESSIRQGKLLALSVDHNHSTGKVRGLLCSNCNVALGMIKESRETLVNMLNYLGQHDETKNDRSNVVEIKRNSRSLWGSSPTS